MNDDVFNRYGRCYDLLYRDKNYPAEADYVAGVLRATDGRSGEILELGSGTGRHGRLLAERGFEVFGVERSAAMVTAAKQVVAVQSSGGKFDCRQGDIRTCRLDRVFDAAISMFHVVSYQTTNDDLLQTFANAARHLRSRGAFFFDVWHGPAVLHERPSVRVKRVEDSSLRITRLAEPNTDVGSSVVTVRYTIFLENKLTGAFETFGEEHRMRYLFPTEIEMFAAQAGFAVERSEEFLSGQCPSEGTWGVAYLLRKRA